MNLSAIPRLVVSPLTGTWFRALNFRFYKTRLNTGHTRTTTSRFSPASPFQPLYRILYLAENHQVAAYETEALFGAPTHPIAGRKTSWLYLALEVKLHRVIDLCGEKQMRLLKTSEQELTGNWANSNSMAPTQELGLALFNSSGVEGFVYPSSKVSGRNLVIYPDKLDQHSSITFHNDDTNKVELLR